MKEDLQLQLQAYLDGELSAADRAGVESLLVRDAEARALVAELRHTSLALDGYESNIKLPETREFYWSKIQREIQREPAETRTASFSLSIWLRRILVPTGAVAALAIAVMLSLPRAGGAGDYFSASGDAVAFTYQNYNTGTTLVWLDFSSENDFSESELDDTLDL